MSNGKTVCTCSKQQHLNGGKKPAVIFSRQLIFRMGIMANILSPRGHSLILHTKSDRTRCVKKKKGSLLSHLHTPSHKHFVKSILTPKDRTKMPFVILQCTFIIHTYLTYNCSGLTLCMKSTNYKRNCLKKRTKRELM